MRASFAAEWLALREPYDLRARNRDVLAAVAAAFADQADIAVVDLACGTGSTLRAARAPPSAAPDLAAGRQRPQPAGARRANAPAGATVTPTPVDIARDLEAALDGALDLVTTSALLDLVSADWLERFAVEAAARRLPVYAALSYDGRASLDPVDPLDAAIIAAVNRHQRRNKGFGPALGPAAASEAIARFQQVGYAVVSGTSDWVFAPDDREIQNEVLAGWASAVRELDDLPLPEIVGWLTRRRELVAAGRTTMRVGHVDVFARPIGAR